MLAWRLPRQAIQAGQSRLSRCCCKMVSEQDSRPSTETIVSLAQVSNASSPTLGLQLKGMHRD